MNAMLRPQSLRGTLLQDEPMARHTSWRVGGPAQRYYVPADVADLCLYLTGLSADEPLFFVGLGSNLLVRDGGLRGSVIATKGLAGIERRSPDTVYVEAGVPSAKVARFCAREGLAGAEFLAGVPGSFGGALAMNAGCFGGETWPLVVDVESVDRHGRLHRRSAEAYRVDYRSVERPADEWFVAATLCLVPGDAESLTTRIKSLVERRAATQPTQQANAGSVFRNPPGEHAGRLIEASGLKGMCIGGACVSEKHANFIVNTGAARAADIEGLMAQVISQVAACQGVRLVPEVHIVGEPAEGDGHV